MDRGSIILQTSSLSKTFGGKQAIQAVKSVDLVVKKGEIFGFLGPNGAGKSTTQKMLSTLLKPTSGTAVIAGYDLMTQQQEIRRHIGFVSQAGGTDSQASGYENLMIHAQLYGLNYEQAAVRIEELVNRFKMESFIHRVSSTYSGGQRRRVDIALGMIHKPTFLLLDEPTVGLDPQSRAYLWAEIKRLRDEGTTIFLTTHYLDEADHLCDTLAIIDHGTIVVHGSPEALKREIGADILVFGFVAASVAQQAATLLQISDQVHKVVIKEAVVRLEVMHGEKMLPTLLRLLDSNSVEPQSVSLAKPSLDDVFLRHTGRSLREEQ